MYSCRALHTDDQGLGEQLEPINNSSIVIQNVAWKTFREQRTLGTSGERGSGKSVLVAHDYIYIYIPTHTHLGFFMLVVGTTPKFTEPKALIRFLK